MDHTIEIKRECPSCNGYGLYKGMSERNLTTTEYLATEMTDAMSRALEYKKEMLEEWREKYT
jgi:hypothetical protein